ncbi:hypothetical protein FACS1894186_5700 [Alphaproteobacteria bacterium]|nr:hypothetical protein FACS1894186_5700 [Alphaproteobacteria bacterium]
MKESVRRRKAIIESIRLFLRRRAEGKDSVLCYLEHQYESAKKRHDSRAKELRELSDYRHLKMQAERCRKSL